MKRKIENIGQRPRLDFSQLLGFRNLVAVVEAEGDFSESSEQLFNKKGQETPQIDRLFE